MKILDWLHSDKKKTWKIILYFSAVFFLLVLFWLVNLFVNQYYNQPIALENKRKIETKKCLDCISRAIDGVNVKKNKSNLFPFAVMIDNHPDARPAHGLSKANLVIEAEAEGGITRYLAIFAGDEDITKIGPIRSIRPYFLEWAEEFSPLLVHCGGSPEALARIIKDNAHDLNEFYNAKTFWRDGNIPAPHNVFTSSKNLTAYSESKNLNEGKFLSWKYSDEIAVNTPKNSEIKINYFSSASNIFEVVWKFNAEKKQYERYLAGKAQLDGEDSIKAANVVIQYINKEVVDEKLRLEIQTVGAGKAVLCKFDQCQEGNWKKADKNSRTRFYLPDGSEYRFFPGVTWIEVVDNSISVSLTSPSSSAKAMEDK